MGGVLSGEEISLRHSLGCSRELIKTPSWQEILYGVLPSDPISYLQHTVVH